MKLIPLVLTFSVLLCSVVEAKTNLSASEQKTNKALATVQENPLLLRDFLFRMPKGGDLHSHLVGAVYAETFIQNAVDQNYCVEPVSLILIPPQKNGDNFSCKADQIPASKAIGPAQENYDLYNSLIDAFSMRNFIPAKQSGHQHFFASFEKFIALEQRNAEWVHEVASRAAMQNEQYLELMITPNCDGCTDLAAKVKGQSIESLTKPESILTQWDFANEVKVTQKSLQEIEQQRLTLGDCTAKPTNSVCKLKTRYLFQALRALPKEYVFAQLAFAFKLLDAEAKSGQPLMVGVNMVMPEDHFYTLQDYTEQMQIIGFLKSQYPKANVTLHAGELTLGLVPPEDLRFQINEAVHIGKAQRIGHGTDIIYEENYQDLLKKMAAEHILVEVNLSSADVILGVEGDNHVFELYQAYGVPLALSTDDEGVLRIDLTHEYQRAVETYNLTYTELKNLVRNSLEYSFLPGESLWQQHDYSQIHTACSNVKLSPIKLTDSCTKWLKTSEKAQQQMELEQRFENFERLF
jgi:adenosine deaminase